MDPNATLDEMLNLANAVLMHDATTGDSPEALAANAEMLAANAVRLAELVVSLHDWRADGGALPTAWSKAGAR